MQAPVQAPVPAGALARAAAAAAYSMCTCQTTSEHNIQAVAAVIRLNCWPEAARHPTHPTAAMSAHVPHLGGGSPRGGVPRFQNVVCRPVCAPRSPRPPDLKGRVPRPRSSRANKLPYEPALQGGHGGRAVRQHDGMQRCTGVVSSVGFTGCLRGTAAACNPLPTGSAAPTLTDASQ